MTEPPRSSRACTPSSRPGPRALEQAGLGSASNRPHFIQYSPTPTATLGMARHAHPCLDWAQQALEPCGCGPMGLQTTLAPAARASVRRIRPWKSRIRRTVGTPGGWGARIQERFIVVAAALLVALSVPAPASASDESEPWPQTVVALEDLRPLTRFELRVRRLVAKGKVKGPAVLRAHIDEAGSVLRAAVLESCGNGDLDEAALHALRAMRFEPYGGAGTPTAVTLVLPVHVPKRFGRSG